MGCVCIGEHLRRSTGLQMILDASIFVLWRHQSRPSTCLWHFETLARDPASGLVFLESNHSLHISHSAPSSTSHQTGLGGLCCYTQHTSAFPASFAQELFRIILTSSASYPKVGRRALRSRRIIHKFVNMLIVLDHILHKALHLDCELTLLDMSHIYHNIVVLTWE